MTLEEFAVNTINTSLVLLVTTFILAVITFNTETKFLNAWEFSVTMFMWFNIFVLITASIVWIWS